MSKRKKSNKKDDQNIIKLALITAIISLIEEIIVLIIKIIELIGAN